MPNSQERAAFEAAHVLWAAGNLEGFLTLFTEDILYTVNVDGLAVPYASSALGKVVLCQRLQLLLDTFTVDRFEPLLIVKEADHFRSQVDGRYTHKGTAEELHVRIRFCVWFREGLIARMSEHLDAAYVEAFERLVFHLQNANRRD